MTTTTYRDASRRRLAQAKEELAAGDTRQASEKGWGAAAQMVKAIAAGRAWEHGGHRQLFSATRRLSMELKTEQVEVWFEMASHLHTNFYEDWLEAETVDLHLDHVERLLDLLEPLV